MTPHGDTWTAEYGRVGSSSQKREYSLSQWEKKYNEKIKKGYVDQTDLVQDLIQVEKKKSNNSTYKEIENKVIAEIVERLQQMAKKAIFDNYTISSNKVTQAMIDKAQGILTELLFINDKDQFNDTLLNLFTVIPRKMKNVSQYLAKSENDYSQIIQAEQDLLDVMKGQVVQKHVENTVAHTDEQNKMTILETLGLEFEKCNKEDIKKIKNALVSCFNKFHNS